MGIVDTGSMVVVPAGIAWKFADGGRAEAGYQGIAGDCVTRSIAIVAQLPYQEVYDRLAEGNARQRRSRRVSLKRTGVRTARHGISTRRKWFQDYMQELGFRWVPTMGIGSGCTVHLRRADLPPTGRYIVRVSHHYTAVIDGVLFDTHDCSRGGMRCVYGYWQMRSSPGASCWPGS